jgi:hypothetical protein
VVRKVVHLELAQGLVGSAVDFGFVQRGGLLEGKGDILDAGEGVEEGVALKKESTAAAEIDAHGVLCEWATLEADPTGVGCDDVGDALEEDGFSRAARAENGEDAAARDAEIHATQDFAAVEAFFDALDGEGWRGWGWHFKRRRN